MKTPALFLLSVMFLFLAHTAATACSLSPTAKIVTDPDGTVFYHSDPVVLDGTTSTANCGSINQYRWQIDDVTVSWSSAWSHTFNLASGESERVFKVQLRVRNTAGKYGYKTIYVTVTRNNKSLYYLTDHLGSVRVTVNEQGDPVGWDDYYPFGLQMPGRTQNASNPNDDQKFTGYELEQQGDLGVYHAGARMYDPVIGRFTSPDPMQEYGSAYVYVGNNPIRWIDEFGLMSNDTLRVLPSGAADGGELPEIEVTAQGNRNATIHRISAMERILFRLDNLGRTENMFGDFVVHARNGHFRVNANQLNVSFGIPGDGLPIGPGGVGRGIKIFSKNGIRTTTHFIKRISQRAGRGITPQKSFEAYKNGRIFYNPNSKNFIRHDSKTGISVVVDKPSNGKIITVFEGKPSPDWIPVRFRPGL
ncbi:MAG: RHS repeat domain-containing protein [Balneolaceae bacterium]